MKTSLIFTLVLILFASFGAKPQVPEGTIWVGGSVNVNSFDVDVANIPRDRVFFRHLNLSPFIGKSFRENAIVGIQLELYKRRERTLPRNVTNTRELSYGGGVFYRRYKLLGKGFYLFGHLSASGSRIKRKRFFNEDPADFEDTKGFNISLELYPGLSYALTKNLHFEIGTNSVIDGYYNNERTRIEWPFGNVRDEHMKRAGISSSFNAPFGARFGFRFIINQNAVDQ